MNRHRSTRWFGWTARLLLLFGIALSMGNGRPVDPGSVVVDDDEDEEASEGDEGENLEGRLRWWHTQRAYPAGKIPDGAYARAWQQWQHRKPRPVAAIGPSSAPSNDEPPAPPAPPPLSWQPVGPAPLETLKKNPTWNPAAGRVTAMAVHPTNPSIVYAGHALGGVWKTSDGGTNWTPISDGQPSLAVGAIAIDPASPTTVYVGTGEGNLGVPHYYGVGLLKSVDGGATWSKPAGSRFTGVSISKIIVDGSTLYMSTVYGAQGRGTHCTSQYKMNPDQGLWKSTDGGVSWTNLPTPSVQGYPLFDFEIDRSSNPRRIFAGFQWYGVYITDDEGQTWSQLTNGLPTQSTTPRAVYPQIAIAPSDSSVIYVGMGLHDASATPTQYGQVYVSTDGGTSWKQHTGLYDYCETQCGYDNVVEVKPNDPKTVLVGGSLCSIFKTTDGTNESGAWVSSTIANGVCDRVNDPSIWFQNTVHVDVHAITFVPNSSTIYAASDGGMAKSLDLGGTWERINDGVATTQFYGVCTHPTDPDGIFGGMQDNGFGRKKPGSLVWSDISQADGGHCFIDPVTPDNGLYSLQNASVYRTTDGFATATKAFPTMTASSERKLFISPLVGDPSNPTDIYVGTHRLWKSSDGGATWSALGTDLTAGLGAVTCVGGGTANDDALSAIAVAPSSSMYLYTGSAAGRVQVSSDGGGTFAPVSSSVLPARWVSGLAVDPINAKTVYASYSGFSASTALEPGHVFRSSDAGMTWESRDIAIDIPVNSVVAHPSVSNIVYVGTDLGVMATNDAGKTWSVLGNGLPSVAVYSLAFQKATSTLVAGTHGRSAWKMKLAPTSDATPTSLTYSAVKGAADPAAQTITISNAETLGSTLDWKAVAADGWVTISGGSGVITGTASQPASVSVSASSLAPGVHTSSVTISATGATNTLVVPLTFTVTGVIPSDDAGSDVDLLVVTSDDMLGAADDLLAPGSEDMATAASADLTSTSEPDLTTIGPSPDMTTTSTGPDLATEPTPMPMPKGGCGCRVATRDEDGARALSSLAALTLVGVLLLRRRRRSG